MMRVKGLTGPQADSVHRIRGLMAPQAALDSVAAARRQAQIDDIASGTPRLMEKAVARGSWFVVRTPPAIGQEWAMVEFHSGLPATAVRSGSRPAPPDSRYLADQKGFGTAPTHKAFAMCFYYIP